MTAKNALLFFLAVFGILFIGLEVLFPVIGLGSLAGAMSTIGALMLLVFLLLVLGAGFVIKMLYLVGSIFCVSQAATLLLSGADLVMGLVFAAISFVLLAFIPSVFLKK